MARGTTIRISAKNLGYLALPEFCPRCLWLKMNCRRGLPFQMFPGIFSSIDSFTKKVTNGCYDRTRSVPAWIERLVGPAEPLRVPHHSVFYLHDPETDVRLTGVPDEILRRSDGTTVIVDYKTARYTDAQDMLLPVYRVQLACYARIAESRGFGPVGAVALIYCEPQLELTDTPLHDVLSAGGFSMPFRAKVVPLRMNHEELVPPLLRELRLICDSPAPPARHPACSDCERLSDMIDLLRRAPEPAAAL